MVDEALQEEFFEFVRGAEVLKALFGGDSR